MSPFTQIDIDPTLDKDKIRVTCKIIFGKDKFSLSNTFTLEEIEEMTPEQARHQRKLIIAPLIQGLLEKINV
jgi:hypothetical protein